MGALPRVTTPSLIQHYHGGILVLTKNATPVTFRWHVTPRVDTIHLDIYVPHFICYGASKFD